MGRWLSGGCVALLSIGGAAGIASVDSSGPATRTSFSHGTRPSSDSVLASFMQASRSSLASLKVAVARDEKAPTKIPLTTPLKKAPPKGKTFVYLQCEQTQCNEAGQALAKAVAAIGWNFKTIDYNDTEPSTVTAAFSNALLDKPAGVAIAGTPQVLWQSAEAGYKAAGVPISAIFIGPATLGFPVIANIGNGADNIDFGKTLADYFIVDSGGKGHVLLANVPVYASLNDVVKGFSQEVAARCPSCSITNLNVSAAELGNGEMDPDVVAALQKDHSIGYVMATDGVFVDELPGALAGAGLSSIKVLAQGGDAQNIADIKAGKVSAISALSASYAAWLSVDATLRHIEGMSMPSNGDDGGVPMQLLTKGSIGTVTGAYKLPATFPQQFEKLWHVG
jgi:ribose transport system substrate-binding protein